MDIRERDLPQETGQTRALNFTKGCYLGQEIVERIRSRGAVHRQFTVVRGRGRTCPSREQRFSLAMKKKKLARSQAARFCLCPVEIARGIRLFAPRGCGKRFACGNGQTETGIAPDRLNFKIKIYRK